MKFLPISIFVVASLPQESIGFLPLSAPASRRPSSTSLDASVGIFFGTSTGSTEKVADLIKEQFGDDADGPFDVDVLEEGVAEAFGKYDALVCGTPTWNTGADTERSGTGWDELYYGSMQELKLAGKPVAVFGLGDQVSYAENYADATGELHDVFENLGCKMYGYTSQEGYEHESSKSIRGDKFCGLLCDEVNQEEFTEERVENWVEQLRNEGFLDAGEPTLAPSVVVDVDVAEPSMPSRVNGGQVIAEATDYEEIIAHLEENNRRLREQLDEYSTLLDRTIESHANHGFEPHYNPRTKVTMWTSPDGRKCYYTADTPQTKAIP